VPDGSDPGGNNGYGRAATAADALGLHSALVQKAQRRAAADQCTRRDDCRKTRIGKDTPLPWFVQRADGAPLVMAGIWQDWEHAGEAFTSCAVVTTAANAAMARIHHRIPVILTEDQWPLWLGEAGKGAATLMESPPEDALSFHRLLKDENSTVTLRFGSK